MNDKVSGCIKFANVHKVHNIVGIKNLGFRKAEFNYRNDNTVKYDIKKEH